MSANNTETGRRSACGAAALPVSAKVATPSDNFRPSAIAACTTANCFNGPPYSVSQRAAPNLLQNVDEWERAVVHGYKTF
ncbi:MAG: hypothetical protein KJ872_11855 [Alphaproteobacteria bacterium]|nr:hypothetical protein [Alphaproteobacteria bacterium]